MSAEKYTVSQLHRTVKIGTWAHKVNPFLSSHGKISQDTDVTFLFRPGKSYKLEVMKKSLTEICP
jgi:hypothetical protein